MCFTRASFVCEYFHVQAMTCCDGLQPNTYSLLPLHYFGFYYQCPGHHQVPHLFLRGGIKTHATKQPFLFSCISYHTVTFLYLWCYYLLLSHLA